MKKLIWISLFFSASVFADGTILTVVWDQFTVDQQKDVIGFKVYCSTVSGGPYILSGTFPGSGISQADIPACNNPSPVGSTVSVYSVVSAYGNGTEGSKSAEAKTSWIITNPPTPNVQMCNSVTPPPVKFIVSPNGTYTTRPLYDATFVKIGLVEILNTDGTPRQCEPTPITKPGVSTLYYYVTNNAGLRGLAICKPQ